ncbi:MAG TPA: hypothetical protein VFV98_11280 [Vicinamibacterales bacterium]|nr:hypothetical protein [Vicinamibacterales bacterium]
MEQHTRAALIIVIAAVLRTAYPVFATAQDLRRDSVWNGVVIGAAAGAGVGALTGTVTEDVCSPIACAGLFAFAGAAIGHLVDRHAGPNRPVQPGSLVDDSLWNGALVGGGVAAAVLTIDLKRVCGKPPDKIECTTGGTVDKLIRAVLWNAAIGALVDAAIPTRAPSPEAGSPGQAGHNFTLQMRVRF